jgi:hypothetical protein
MRHTSAIVLFRAWLLTIVCTLPCHAASFGFERGMTPEQVTRLVGPSAITNTMPDQLGGVQYTLSTAPSPHREFEQYVLVFSKDSGLLRVVAIGKNFQTSSDGLQLRDHYDSLCAAMKTTYVLERQLDFARPGSPWNKPRDFMMGLLKNDRVLAAFFKDGQGDHVIIEPSATDSSNGYITVSYEYPGWDEYFDRIRAKGANAF